jgi:pimeloyl-ACP methyl ester carboxylesterase
MIKRRYVDGRWGHVHLRQCGEGPPLVLLHQSPISSVQFQAGMAGLAKAGFCAIAIDTPGFGQSDPPPAPVTIPDYAEALVTTLDALGHSQVHLLGHHTGASIAANFAGRWPARVNRLILNGVPLFSAEELAFFRTFKFQAIKPQADGSHLVAAWNQRLAATPGWTDIDAMHRYVVDMLAIPERNHWGFLAALDYDIGKDLARLTMPTLILSNSGEDLYAASMRAAQTRPDFFSFAALDGGTHDIVDEQPDAWARAVADFLQGT